MSSYVIIDIPRGNRVYATTLRGAKVYIKPGQYKARRSGTTYMIGADIITTEIPDGWVSAGGRPYWIQSDHPSKGLLCKFDHRFIPGDIYKTGAGKLTVLENLGAYRLRVRWAKRVQVVDSRDVVRAINSFHVEHNHA